LPGLRIGKSKIPAFFPAAENSERSRKFWQKNDIKGEKGAYFVSSDISLPEIQKKWKIIANVNQNHAQIISLWPKIKEIKILKNNSGRYRFRHTKFD
jgi:hypothetical protein